MDKISEAVWCDHVKVLGIDVPRGTRAVRLNTIDVPTTTRAIRLNTLVSYIVVEEGKVKIMCPVCFLKAL